MSCEFAHDDGAYVLGAMSPAERERYEHHLAGCPACREAVGEIAVLPGLLGRLDQAGLDRVAGPPSTGPQVTDLLAGAATMRRRDRLRRRWRYAGVALVAGCLALFVGLGVGSLRTVGPDGTDFEIRTVTMAPVAGSVPVTAEIGLNGATWGTEVIMRCSYAETEDYAKAYTFRLVAYGPDGASEQVGSWKAAPGDDVTFTGATRFSAEELVRIELTRYDGTPLLAYDVP
ncbi:MULTISPECIES: zf-HC2 domain-containing protein [Polymorphospora]|uniref:Zf-HC2 domain-containing protein n=1 Tax=Polymorphospora lycopeni TaxID=3140240 RepID=A0ABV5CN51_9ACTN